MGKKLSVFGQNSAGFGISEEVQANASDSAVKEDNEHPTVDAEQELSSKYNFAHDSLHVLPKTLGNWKIRSGVWKVN